jgi:hypothetical protein
MEFNKNLIVFQVTVYVLQQQDIKTCLNNICLSFVKGHWQYKISLSYSKELLKLYIKLYYQFVVSCLVFEIFRPKLMSCEPSWTNS